MELISVIVPVYNVEKYLKRCVDSIRVQTYKNLEIILVDDGSPDKSGALCEAMKLQDDRIKVIHKENGGLGFARNSGLEIATGKYVTFIDSDDWISKNHIENLARCILENKADLCIGGYTATNGRKETEIIHPAKIEYRVYNKKEIKEKILFPLIGPDVDYPSDVQLESSSCMNLYCMSLIREFGVEFISEKHAVAEDLYFNIDFLAHSSVAVVSDEIGYYYFENHNSISRRYDCKRFERTINFWAEVNKRVEDYHLSDQVSYRVHRSYLTKIRVAIRHIVLSDLNLNEKILEIRHILKHSLTKKVLKEYPINSYIPVLRVTTYLMKYQMIWLLYLMIRGREVAKSSKLLSAILRKIGIGK